MRSGDVIMRQLKEKDIIPVTITGIQNYGAFADICDEYAGLIHISEISYGFVKNISDYLTVGERIYAEVVEVDVENRQVKLSIKDIDYKHDGTRIQRMAETKSGFTPLRDHLDEWINEKIKEITDKI